MTRQIKMLLVMARERYAAILGRLDHHAPGALLAATHDEARLVLAGRPHLDVVLTDLRLPDGDWDSVMKEIERSQSFAELVVCTGLVTAQLWCDILDRGAYDLLVEPYDAEEVHRIVEGAAARSCRRSEAAAAGAGQLNTAERA